MKKILLFLILGLSLNLKAQTTELNKKIGPFNLKNIKIGLAGAGGCIATGALIDVIRTYKEAPIVSNYTTSQDFSKAADKYSQNQKDLKRVSSMFYGFSGIALISICFNF